MDVPSDREQARSGQGWRLDLAYLGVLLLLALGLRLWVIGTTTVPARDSIGFIRYALQLERWSYKTVLAVNHQHPGYPAAVLLMSWPLRERDGAITCANMQLAAQLASALAGWLLVVPMFYLGQQFFDRQVAFWGTLLFQCLPDSSHSLSDGISDPLYLLFLTIALLFAVRGLNRRGTGVLVLAGIFTGLAYLVRPEAALLLAATLAVLLLLQRWRSWRTSWSHLLVRGAALVVPAVLAGSPYWFVTGSFTVKPSIAIMIGQREAALGPGRENPCPVAGPPLATLLGVHIDLEGGLPRRVSRAVRGLLEELIHAFQYISWLPALLGLWWYRQKWQQAPGAGMIGLLLLMLLFLLVWLAASAGYVSNRHLLLLVLCLVFPAAALLRDLPLGLFEWLRQRGWLPPIGGSWLLRPGLWAALVLLGVTGSALARSLQPLHHHRGGHLAAGRWLAHHAAPHDIIDDDHCWAHYYAGHVFREFQPCRPPAGVEPRRFVVYSRASERRPPSHRRSFTEKELKEQGGQVVFHWPEQTSVDQARVLVYHVPTPSQAAQLR